MIGPVLFLCLFIGALALIHKRLPQTIRIERETVVAVIWFGTGIALLIFGHVWEHA